MARSRDIWNAGRTPYRKLDTGAAVHGGSNVGNAGGVQAEAHPWTGQPWSVTLTLPPLGVLMLKPSAGP
jgi:1,4-alpha-glucan branching enzyme